MPNIENIVNYDLKQVLNSNADSEVKDINAWPLQSSDMRRDEAVVSPMDRQRKYNDSQLSYIQNSAGETIER